MAGPKWDELHITTIGQVLKDAASCWYTNNVKSPYLEQEWSFENLICELFKHFIHGSSAQKALDVYNKIQYLNRDQVQNYHLELELKAKQLIVAPDPYSFRMRLIDRLPLSIQETLIKREHITAEHNTIDEIVKVVYNIEESNDAFDHRMQDSSQKYQDCGSTAYICYASFWRPTWSRGR
jgi:hypothetical protein